MRKTMLAAAAALALGLATTGSALAAHGGGGGGHGGGGGFGGHAGGGGFGGHAGGGGFGGHAGGGGFGGHAGGFSGRMGGGNTFNSARVGGAAPMAHNNFGAGQNHFASGRNWRGGRGRGGFGGVYAFGGPDYYDYDYGYYDNGCLVRRPVPTPFGLRWRVVNVCY